MCRLRSIQGVALTHPDLIAVFQATAGVPDHPNALLQSLRYLGH